jgi:predicted naringenin-chalcone synthase
MDIAILGWGTALPPTSVPQGEAAAFAVNLNGLSAAQARLVPGLYRRTGIQTRCSVLARAVADGGVSQDFYPRAQTPEDRGPTTHERMRIWAEAAPPLARDAARRALQAASLPPEAITHVVTVTCSGFTAPGIDFSLIRDLGLSPTTERIQVGFMGCHGALNGLKTAAALAAQHPRARVLLCAVELCSLHYQYGGDPDRVIANALFADGAAAVVLGQAAAPRAWRVRATGSCLFANSQDAMTWNIGDHGFVMTLSARVPELIESHLRPWLEGWLGSLGLFPGDIGSWAVHPGGPRIVQAVQGALGLPEGHVAESLAVLRELGNMSSPTILFILSRLAAREAPRPCLALAFGPGLVAEAALFG